MALSTTIKHKIGTTEQWKMTNRVLALGELGIEINDKLYPNRVEYLMKVGDGVTDWKHLHYCNGYQQLIELLNQYKETATNPASPYYDGLMSKEDKLKLDNMKEFDIDDKLNPQSDNPLSNRIISNIVNEIYRNINNVKKNLNDHENNATMHFDVYDNPNGVSLKKAFVYNMLAYMTNNDGGDKYRKAKIVGDLSYDNEGNLLYHGDRIGPDMTPYATMVWTKQNFVGSIDYNENLNILTYITGMGERTDIQLSGIKVTNVQPTSITTLWIDTGNGGQAKYYDPNTKEWTVIAARWG